MKRLVALDVILCILLAVWLSSCLKNKGGEDPTPDKEPIELSHYYWGVSDSPGHVGNGVFIPSTKFTGRIKTVAVDLEKLAMVSQLFYERNVFFASKPPENYKKLTMELTNGSIYIVTLKEVEEDDNDNGKLVREKCRYHAQTNGDRATFYCSKNMNQYPAKLVIDIPGIKKTVVTNNGKRWPKDAPKGYPGLLVKQSEVQGRTMSIMTKKGHHGKICHIEYRQ